MALTASMALASFAMLTDSSYMEVRISSLEEVLIARGKAVVHIHKLSHRSDTAGQLAMQLISNGGLRVLRTWGRADGAVMQGSPLPKVLLGPRLVLLCSWNMGSCRRRSDAGQEVFSSSCRRSCAGPSRKYFSAPGLCKTAPLKKVDALSNVPRGLHRMALLYLWVMQGMSNGGLLCSESMGRADGALTQDRKCSRHRADGAVQGSIQSRKYFSALGLCKTAPFWVAERCAICQEAARQNGAALFLDHAWDEQRGPPLFSEHGVVPTAL
ncbi:unnamed protein product [Symbiodinium natans]|uniref:Uncharacterized protein n=1 Tax=Symbiodinium natans TaxID=878477 RepID=A0A812T4M2_9DINO|nr:unnamed protein product [Symbiodinium natans]